MKNIHTLKQLLIGIKYWSLRSFFLVFALISLGTSQMWGAELKEGQYIYINYSTSTWGSSSAKFKFNWYWNVGDYCCVNQEAGRISGVNYAYAQTQNAYTRAVQILRFNSDYSSQWNYTNTIAVSDNTKNCITLTASVSDNYSFSWTTYAPPMSTTTLSDNGTSIVSGSGTSGDPYCVYVGATIKVSAAGTKAVEDPDATINYDFKQGSTSKQNGTSTTYQFTASSTANTSYTINLDGYTKVGSTSSTKKAATAIYYKTIAVPVDPTVTLTASKTTGINIGETITLTATGSNASNITKYEFYEGSTKKGTVNTSSGTATYSYTPTTTGNKTVKVVMTYNSGSNTVTSSNVALTLNTPSVALAVKSGSPTDIYLGETTTIMKATPSNVGAGVTPSYVFTDQASPAVSSSSQTSKEWTYTPGTTGTKTMKVTMTVDGSTYTATTTVNVYEHWNIYVKNNCGWANGIYNYNWDAGGNKGLGNWPGTSVSVYQGAWYTVTLDSKYSNVILHGNNSEQTNDISADKSIHTAGTFWEFVYDHEYNGTKYYYLTKNTSLSNPTVYLDEDANSSYVVNTTTLFLTGHITNYGGDGSAAADMLEVGFEVNGTKYPMNCKTGDDASYFWGYVTGLTAGTAYTVKAYATNIHGTGKSSGKSYTTRAAGNYTIKVRSLVERSAPKIYAWTYTNTECNGLEIKNAAWPGTTMTTDISGTTYKWYSYTMSNDYNKFVISEGTDATKTDDFDAPLEDKCYWYTATDGTQSNRMGEMTCPFSTPQLMINHGGAVEGGTSGSDYVYYTMTLQGDGKYKYTVSNLPASDNYQFKIVYLAEWYGKGTGDSYSTIDYTHRTETSLAQETNNLLLHSNFAGDYSFYFNPNDNSIEVEFPNVNQLQIYGASPAHAGIVNNYDFGSPDGTTYSKTLTLNAKTTYRFKVVYNCDYYGFKTGEPASGENNSSNPMTINNCTDWRMYTDGGDSYLYAPVAGDYTFSFNSDHVVSGEHLTDLSVTFPEAYTVTFGYGTGGSAVTASATSAGGAIESGDYVASGDNITFTQTPISGGYTFKGWYTTVDGNTTVATMGVSDNILNGINANKTVYAQYTPNNYIVSLDVDEDHKGTIASATTSHTVTYNAVTTNIPNLPTAADGYGLDGFYTDHNGTGTKLINGDGSFIASVSGFTDSDKKWIRIGGVTLYAYYKQAEITALTITPAVTAPSGTVTATPTISPVPGGAAEICWRLLHSNGNIMDSQPTFTSAGGNAVTFTAPETSGTYLVAAILHTGTGCGNGTVLDSVTSGFQVAGDHNVTVQYKCGDVTIQASTTVTGRPLATTEITAPEIFGYTFSKWKQGDGITITGADANGEKATATITFTAIYDGTLTAIYTQNQIIYFKNTLGWSSVYVNLLTTDYWDNTNGSGNTGRSNRNLQMSLVDGTTDIYYYDYGNKATSHFISFTQESMDGYNNFYQASPNVAHVVFPSRYSDNTNLDKATEGGFYAGTPMFVPLAGQTPIKKNNNRAEYYNSGYWTKYTAGTGYTLEIYYDYDESPTVKSIPFTSDDELMPMKAVADLEANTTYRFQLKRDGDVYYGNSGTMTYADHGQGTAWEMTNTDFTKCKITTNAAGDYTFNLSYSANSTNPPQYRLRMAVDYPIASGDYRLIYKDGVHTAWHPSAIVPKVNNGKDTVSFFIRPNNASRVLKIQQATVDGETGAISWEDKSTITSSISSLPQDSVYNINLPMDGSGNISVESVDPYTGNFYIRTDCANSKWDNYRSDPDHRMTYSEYSITHGGYSHYYCHWVEAADAHRKNVKFTIANDYSPCISDTLTRETSSGTWANIATFIDGDGNILRDANVRFMWDQHTNTISRAYIDGAQGHANDFLVLRSSDSKIADIDNSATILTEVKFLDNQNWIYEANVKAKPNALIKLTSTWGVGTTILQYFKGTESTTETLITGSGDDWYDIRLLYDFKTNRLVAAMVPSGNIEDPTPINADVMFIRDHQGDISQITFTDDGAITNIQTAYGVVRFNKWTLNNKDRETHNPLASPSSRHERGLYFISFPFRVNLEEVFGFGKYGTHWIIQYYDGAARAANGFWEGDPGFWTFIWDRRGVFLEPNQGYLLTLDLDELGESSSVWANNSERAELFFPSYGEMPNITSATVTHSIPAHTCTINWYEQKGIPGSDTGDPRTSYDRRVYDSHWNVMSVPTYVNTNSIAFANTDWTSSGTGKVGPKFLYTWNMDDNTLTATSGSGFTYHAMHAYMVQYNGNVTWTASGSPVSPIVARRTYETPKEVEFRLEVRQDDKMIDQTFINMSDDEEVSAGFAFNEDLTKEFNSRKANIYTLINGIMTVAGNTMPMSEQMTIVPVGVTISTTGDYTFAMPDGTDGVGVTLVDNETGIRTSLSALNYTINLEAGDYKERFFLEISPIKNTPTGVETISDEGLEVSGARKVMIDGILYIVKDGRMYDARGTRVE